jgi:hypothetical protein
MMPKEDLVTVILSVLEREAGMETAIVPVQQLAVTMAVRILARDQELATAYQPLTMTRAQFAEMVELERHRPTRRREMPVSLPNLDTPEIIAERLRILAEIPIGGSDAVDPDVDGCPT